MASPAAARIPWAAANPKVLAVSSVRGAAGGCVLICYFNNLFTNFGSFGPMWNSVKTFMKSESGATVIEYSFLISLVGVSTIGAYSKFAGSLTNMWAFIESNFTTSVGN
jgi:Flp pilus assembly pilin Flp